MEMVKLLLCLKSQYLGCTHAMVVKSVYSVGLPEKPAFWVIYVTQTPTDVTSKATVYVLFLSFLYFYVFCCIVNLRVYSVLFRLAE